MQIEFMSESRSGGGRPLTAAKEETPKNSSGLVWWTIIITLLIGLATSSWLFSIYVFTHPEKPFSYRILAKFDKLEPLTNFTPISVPTGEFKSSRELFSAYYGAHNDQLAVINNTLMRHYLRNYASSEPVYVKGTFRVAHARHLTQDDPFTSGLALRATSVDFPNVVLELILPGPHQDDIPFQPGDDITIDTNSTFASVVHIDREASEVLTVSALSIVYRSFPTPDESVNIAQAPPERLNLDGTLPVIGFDGAAIRAVPVEVAETEPRN